MGIMSGKLFWNTCGTPGAVYGTKITSDKIVLTIKLPSPMLKPLNDSRREHLIRSLHYAILPVVEGIFQERWRKLAGRKLKGDDGPLPETWAQLFTAE